MLGVGAFTEFHYQDESPFLRAILDGPRLVPLGLNRCTLLYLVFFSESVLEFHIINHDLLTIPIDLLIC